MFFSQLLIPQIILQVLCILHVVRKGRDRMWIYIILFLPFLGAIAYLIAEILPTLRSRSLLENANQQIGNIFLPSRRIQILEEQIALADTYQNRMLLGEAYAANQRFDEAIDLFTKTLKGIYKDDPFALAKRACAYYASGNMAMAKADFVTILQTKGALDEKEQLIYAITLAQLEELEASEKAFQKAATLSTGLEAEYHYAVFLKRIGKLDEAKETLQYMLIKAKSSPSYFRRREAKWLGLAKEEFRNLQ